MTHPPSIPVEDAPKLQEAVDTVVQAFGHPATLAVEYSFDGSEKRTLFEVTTAEERVSYELVYDGRRDETEPELVRLD